MTIIISIALCFVTAFLAERKGYGALPWFFAAGPIGWIALARLTDIKEGNLPQEEASLKKRSGNTVGIGISIVALILSAIFSYNPHDASPWTVIAILLTLFFVILFVVNIIALAIRPAKAQLATGAPKQLSADEIAKRWLRKEEWLYSIRIDVKGEEIDITELKRRYDLKLIPETHLVQCGICYHLSAVQLKGISTCVPKVVEQGYEKYWFNNPAKINSICLYCGEETGDR